MLLLDEPTNHLDAESVEWLEQFLQRFPGTVCAITHDRYFLDNAAEWILELDRGRGIPWKGNYSSWLDQKDQRLAQEEATESARRKAIKRELEWVRAGTKGRQAKSKAASRASTNCRRTNIRSATRRSEIFIPVADRLGDKVISFKNVRKGYGDRILMDELSFDIPPGRDRRHHRPERCGQDDALPHHRGQGAARRGHRRVGPSVKLAVVDQSREALDDSKTPFEEIGGGNDLVMVGRFEMPARAYLGRFNLKGGDQQKPIGTLSGGERGRLHLAKTLISGANVLLLDEPSNDLDVETLRALEDALGEFAGTVLVVSHDRWFLDRVATHILAFEDDARVVFHEGNYQEYEADKKARLGEEAARPHRIRYKPLTLK